MRMQHISTDAFYRAPLGALPAGENVCLRVALTDCARPETVSLRTWDTQERIYPMRLLGAREDVLYYEAQITVCGEPMLYWYRFEVTENGRRYVLGASDDGTGCGSGVMGSENSFQITVYDPKFHTPEWLRDGVMYQIMVDRFFHGEGTDALLHAKPGAIIEIHKRWNEMPFLNVANDGDNFANDFYGGNLEGVRQKLGYLKELGVSVIYFNPIFTASSNHKYNTSDYMSVDPMYGDEKKLVQLCEEAKALGIRIILDGVFSHVGDDSVYFNRRGFHGEDVGAYKNLASPYSKWFTFKSWPNDYDCWWGFRTLPNVNEMDEDFRRYILNGEDAVVKHWVRRGTSGWRLDVADELPMEFLRELRREVKSVDEDAVVLGEVWEDASHKVAYDELRSYVTGDTLDTTMNYPLRDALIGFLMGYRSAGEAKHALDALNQNYPKPFLYSLMNMMGSHDRPRILNVLGGNDGNDIPRPQRAFHHLTVEDRLIGTQRESMMLRMVMSVPGIPCVYYGDEAGLEGCADPFCRRTYPWGLEDKTLMREYKAMIAMRNTHPELRTGECRYIAPCESVLGVVRTISGGRDVFGKTAENAATLTLINRSTSEQEIYLTVDDFDGAQSICTEDGETLYAAAGAFSVHLGALQGITLFASADKA